MSANFPSNSKHSSKPSGTLAHSFASGLSAYEEFISNLQVIPMILLHYASFIVEILQILALCFDPHSTYFIFSALLHCGQESCFKLWVLLFMSVILMVLIAYLLKLRLYSDGVNMAVAMGGMSFSSHSFIITTRILYIPLSYIFLRVYSEGTSSALWLQPKHEGFFLGSPASLCIPSFLSSFSLVLLSAWIILSSVVYASFCDVTLGYSHTFSSPRMLCEILLSLLKFFSVGFYVFLPYHSYRNTINVLIGSAMLALIIHHHPSYNPRVDHTRVAVISIFVWLSFVHAVLGHLSVTFTVEMLLTYSGVFILPAIMYYIGEKHFFSYAKFSTACTDSLTTHHQKANITFKNEHQAILAMRYNMWLIYSTMFDHKERPVKKKDSATALERDIAENTNSKELYLKALATRYSALWEAATSQFPTSAYVHFLSALHYMNISKDFTKALAHLKMGHQNLTTWQVDLRVALMHANTHRYQLIFETYKENSEEFRSKFLWVKKCELDTQRRTRFFWRMLTKSNIDSEILFSLTEDISRAYSRVEDIYSNLIRMFPISPLLLRSYSSFMEDMGGEYGRASRLIELADEIDWNKRQEGGTQESYSSSESELTNTHQLSVSGGGSVGSAHKVPDTRKRNIARKLANLSVSSFQSRAAQLLTGRFGLSLLFLCISATVMFAITGSLFGVYRENIHFLHSSGMGRHLAQKVVLSTQMLRREYYFNNSLCVDKARSDLDTSAKKLAELHKNLYLFQKTKDNGILTDFYERPSITVLDPTELKLNYYDIVNLFTRKARDLARNPFPEVVASANGTNPMSTPHFHFLMEYGPTVVAEGMSKAGALLRDQNQQQSTSRRAIFGGLMGLNIYKIARACFICNVIAVIAIFFFVLLPIERSIQEERYAIIKLFRSIPHHLASEIVSRLKKTERDEFKMVPQGDGVQPSDFLSNKALYQSRARKKPEDYIFRYAYVIGIPILVLCSFLQFSVSYNLEATGRQVNREIHAAAERLSLTSQLHFLFAELLEARYQYLPRECYNYDFLGPQIAKADSEKSVMKGMHYWQEDALAQRIKETLPLLESYHYMLRFGGEGGTEASIGRHPRQYDLLNDPLCQTLNRSDVACNNTFLLHYCLEDYGLDELFFRFVGLCRRIEHQPNRLAELSFLDWLLVKALTDSMDCYVVEQKHSLLKAEWDQYMIFGFNLLALAMLYALGGHFVASSISRSLDRCRMLFLMLPESVIDSSPYIREFLATGIASTEEDSRVNHLSFFQRFRTWWVTPVDQPRPGGTSFAVLYALDLPFIMLNPQYRITGLNKRAEALLGYTSSSSELLGESIDILGCQVDLLAATKEAMKHNNSLVCELRHKKGVVLTVDARVININTQTSSFAFVVDCNLTPYICDNNVLSEEITHLNAVFASIAEPLILCSADGDILHANSMAVKLFGYGEDQIVGKSLDFLLPHQDFAQRFILESSEAEEMRLLLPNDKEGTFSNIALGVEVHGLTSAGNEIPLEVSVSRFSLDGKHKTEFIAVVKDMSARKKMEKAYVTAQKEKAANVAKSVFLANMSHELRTPLNGIILTSQLLAEADLTQELQEYVDTIRCCAESLFALINDILDFSKIEAGKLNLEETPFYPVDTIDEVVSSLSAQASEKRIELISFVDPQVPKFLYGDARRLRQILLNLLSNAVKFTSIGHVLTTATLKGQEGEYYEILFKVSDTGIGIRESNMDQLFARFSQIDASSTRQFHGSGLGLVISKELVTMLKGKIGVESEFGRGSTFWFTCKFKADTNADSKPPNLEALEVLRLQDLMVVVLVRNLVLSDIICQYLRMWRVRSLPLDSIKKASPYLHSRLPWPSSSSPIWLVEESFSNEILNGVPPNTPVIRLAFPPTIEALRSLNRHHSEENLMSLGGAPDSGRPSTSPSLVKSSSVTMTSGDFSPPLPAGSAGDFVTGVHHDPVSYTVQIAKPVTHKKLLEALLIALEKFPTIQKRKSAPTIVTSWNTNSPKVLSAIPEGTNADISQPASRRNSGDIGNDDNNNPDNTDYDRVLSPKPQQTKSSMRLRRSEDPASTLPFNFDSPVVCDPLTKKLSFEINVKDDTSNEGKHNADNDNSIRGDNGGGNNNNRDHSDSDNSGHHFTDNMDHTHNYSSLETYKMLPEEDLGVLDTLVTKLDEEEEASTKQQPTEANTKQQPTEANTRGEDSSSVVVVEDDAAEKQAVAATTDDQEHGSALAHSSEYSGPYNFGKSASDFRNFLKKNRSMSIASTNAAVDYSLPEEAQKWRVLLVEDNFINQKAVSTLLRKMNCEVTAASNGVEAVESFERARANGTPYEIVLMDCQMPVMDGYTATREIRHLEAENNLPPVIIIAVTAHATNSDKQQCLESGMNDYICKPLRKEHIVGMFTKWLQQPSK